MAEDRAPIAALSREQIEQGMLLKRLEQTRDTLARIESRIGPYRPSRAPAHRPRGFSDNLHSLVRDIGEAADRLDRATAAMES